MKVRPRIMLIEVGARQLHHLEQLCPACRSCPSRVYLFVERYELLLETSRSEHAKLLVPLRSRSQAATEVVAHQHLPIFHTEHCVFARFLSKGSLVKGVGFETQVVLIFLLPVFRSLKFSKSRNSQRAEGGTQREREGSPEERLHRLRPSL